MVNKKETMEQKQETNRESFDRNTIYRLAGFSPSSLDSIPDNDYVEKIFFKEFELIQETINDYVNSNNFDDAELAEKIYDYVESDIGNDFIELLYKIYVKLSVNYYNRHAESLFDGEESICRRNIANISLYDIQLENKFRYGGSLKIKDMINTFINSVERK